MVAEATLLKLNKESILQFLRDNRSVLRAMGVVQIGLFGSFAKGNQGPDSDIDLFVDMEKADLFKLAELALFLEAHFERKVDLLRKGKHLRPTFLRSIETTLVYA